MTVLARVNEYSLYYAHAPCFAARCTLTKVDRLAALGESVSGTLAPMPSDQSRSQKNLGKVPDRASWHLQARTPAANSATEDGTGPPGSSSWAAWCFILVASSEAAGSRGSAKQEGRDVLSSCRM